MEAEPKRGQSPDHVALLWPTRILQTLQQQPMWVLGAGLLLVLIAAMLATFDPRTYHGGDNALYWALGKSLAEQFEYRDLGAPGGPFETSVPWGFPALLAVGMTVLPGEYIYLKSISFFSMVGAFACLWALLHHVLRDHRGLALLALVLCAVNHRLFCYGTHVLSEGPYLLVSIGALLSFEWYRNRAGSRWWLILPAALLASYSYLIRPVGLSLVLALLGYLLLTKNWRPLVLALLVVVVVDGSWHLRCQLRPSEAENLYLSHLVKESKFQAGDERVDATGMVARVLKNTESYARGPVHRLSVGRKWTASTPSPVSILFLVFFVVGYLASLGRAGPLHLYLPMYLGILLLWLPESVKDRYLAMVYPLMLALALFGVWWLISRRWPQMSGWAVLLVFGFLLHYNVDHLSKKIADCADVQGQYLAGDHQTGRRNSYRSFVEMCQWAAENTPPDAVLGARKPRLAYFYSGRVAVRPTYSDDPEEILQWLGDSQIDYMLLDRIDNRVANTTERFEPVIEQYDGHFRKAYTSSFGDTTHRFAVDEQELPVRKLMDEEPDDLPIHGAEE